MQISERDRRMLMILGAVAVAAVLLFVFVLHHGSGSPAASNTNAATVTTPTTSGASVPALAPSPKAQTPTVLVFSGRDPFKALVDTTTVATSTSTSTSGSGTTGSGTSGVTPAPSPSSGPTDGSSVTLDGHTIVLDDIFTQDGKTKVQVEVDGSVYTVESGKTFAGNYKLVSVSGSTASFLYGDQPFTLVQPPHSGS